MAAAAALAGIGLLGTGLNFIGQQQSANAQQKVVDRINKRQHDAAIKNLDLSRERLQKREQADTADGLGQLQSQNDAALMRLVNANRQAAAGNETENASDSYARIVNAKNDALTNTRLKLQSALTAHDLLGQQNAIEDARNRSDIAENTSQARRDNNINQIRLTAASNAGGTARLLGGALTATSGAFLRRD